MLVAVTSDVHGNLEALTEVLKDIGAQGPAGADEILHLGDAVGYGPDPEACVHLLLARGATALVGNHERGLTDPKAMNTFNPQARAALERTRQLMSPAAVALLADWPEVAVRHGARFVHGLPPDSVNSYLFSPPPKKLAAILNRLPEKLSFVGHTHEPQYATVADGLAVLHDLPEGEIRLDPDQRHIVGVGSVGQPRDLDNRAAYVLWDTEQNTVNLRRLPYDNRATARKILDCGLDKRYADRLM